MKIGIVGSGVVATTLGGGFLRHGHEVALGTREPAKLGRELINSLGRMTRESAYPMAGKSLHRSEMTRCAKSGCKILSRVEVCLAPFAAGLGQ